MPDRKTEITGWTALRGVAALWVVLFHFRNPFTPELTQAPFESGYLGVELFFVLSGAVMYYVYEQDLATRRFSYPAFLLKRVARLYPVHLVTILASAALIFSMPQLILGGPPPYDLGPALIVNLAMLQSIPILDGTSLNYPAWSISAEFFAYLAFPALAALLVYLGLRRAALAGLVMFAFAESIATRLTGQCLTCQLSITQLTYDFSILRVIPEFFAGLVAAAVAFRHADRLTPHARLIFILATAAILLGAMFRIDLAVLVAAPPLVLSLALWTPRVPRPLLWLGRISYSLYMSHLVTKMALLALVDHLGGPAKGDIPLAFLPLALLASLGVAAAVYHLVEQPGQKALLGLFAHRGTARDTGKVTPAE